MQMMKCAKVIINRVKGVSYWHGETEQFETGELLQLKRSEPARSAVSWRFPVTYDQVYLWSRFCVRLLWKQLHSFEKVICQWFVYFVRKKQDFKASKVHGTWFTRQVFDHVWTHKKRFLESISAQGNKMSCRRAPLWRRTAYQHKCKKIKLFRTRTISARLGDLIDNRAKPFGCFAVTQVFKHSITQLLSPANILE